MCVSMIRKIENKFKDLFSSTPRIFRSPGRINIIGEHTDYNDGFVLPAAIDKQIIFAVAPNTVGLFRMFADDLQDYVECKDVVVQQKSWANYLLGVINQFQKRGLSVPSVDVVFGGDIPMGSGLSSSAALECGFAYALNALFEYGLSTQDMIYASQMAEHEFIGVRCGIMDQSAVMLGRKDSVIRLDCRSLEHSFYPFRLQGYTVILANSLVKHELASSEYNVRRSECEAGVNIVAHHYNTVRSLRDITIEQLDSCREEMSATVYMRCKYVIEENSRVVSVCKAMQNDDITTVGSLLYATHEGLKSQYAVSCPEVDILVDIAHAAPGVVGSRIMGGGFGGCSLSLVANEALDDFKQRLVREYYHKYAKPETIFQVKISDGTSEIQK